MKEIEEILDKLDEILIEVTHIRSKMLKIMKQEEGTGIYGIAGNYSGENSPNEDGPEDVSESSGEDSNSQEDHLSEEENSDSSGGESVHSDNSLSSSHSQSSDNSQSS